ncbi:hypothetical protein GPA27_05085 [Aromatoleum toluolicum]|uniref:Uncharacterized protein n=1 Tax=Aromatoleum toluolicum TaxID=90060 RepID=A0ABX1NC05_9RHOO|nr:hypothetical protein [Aromatoleum toluolicum]NMF96758.1 hypothetical protein [Aromatoleum toluolicum]
MNQAVDVCAEGTMWGDNSQMVAIASQGEIRVEDFSAQAAAGVHHPSREACALRARFMNAGGAIHRFRESPDVSIGGRELSVPGCEDFNGEALEVL